MFPQLVQVDFIAQCCTKSCQRSSRIILAPIEAAVDQCLDAPPQRVKQGSNGQRGDDNGHIIRVADEPTQESLRPDDQACISCADFAYNSLSGFDLTGHKYSLAL